VIVYSRDELKQSDMQMELREQFDEATYGKMRFFLGDVRDRERLTLALRGVDIVIHAAALKQVPAAEYNPSECIHTNIMGAENVVWASLNNARQAGGGPVDRQGLQPDQPVWRDQAGLGQDLRGGQQPVGRHRHPLRVVRYGNVVGSRGSVVPLYKRLLSQGATELPVTDARMTRFWITLNEGVEFVLSSLEIMRGGEIFVPKIPSMTMPDLVKAMSPDAGMKIVGIRPGEKLHEMMISADDARATVELEDRYVIEPTFVEYPRKPSAADGAKPVAEGFSYSSDNNDDWLSEDGLRHAGREGLMSMSALPSCRTAADHRGRRRGGGGGGPARRLPDHRARPSRPSRPPSSRRSGPSTPSPWPTAPPPCTWPCWPWASARAMSASRRRSPSWPPPTAPATSGPRWCSPTSIPTAA
jgi:UDP-N-acetylglucosamine 4,6-dehydratase